MDAKRLSNEKTTPEEVAGKKNDQMGDVIQSIREKSYLLFLLRSPSSFSLFLYQK